MSKKIVVLGSTGSIGRQTLEIIYQHPDLFELLGISAGGSQLRALLEQAVEFRVPAIGVSRCRIAEVEELLDTVKQEKGVADYKPDLLVGTQSSAELAAIGDALIVNAITGSIGLEPTLAALEAGNKVALANKESLVAGGELILSAAQRQGGVLEAIYPIDSEHSALAQCLHGRKRFEVERLILTASGGPFRGYTADRLKDVSVEEAMSHPTWKMGTVITINSATLVNKGLELIEAALLFGVPADRIDAVVHPQSIIHSMVQYIDGSVIAQASLPDMKLPISLALNMPYRLEGAVAPLNFGDRMAWNFEPVDDAVFPAVALARHAFTAGKTFPAVYNAANEEAVAAFIAGRLRLPDIARVIDSALTAHVPAGRMSLETVTAAQEWARSHAASRLALL